MKTALTQYIRQFAPFSDTEIAQVMAHFEQKTLRKGQFLLKQGGLCRSMAYLHTGYMRLYFEAEARETTQWISSPKSLVTDLASFIFESPARWNIEALTDCEMLVIERDAYMQLKKALPKWAELDGMFLAKCFISLEERVFSHVLYTAEERYQMLLNQQPALFQHVPLQYVASMLGMSAETLSRLRKKERDSAA